VPIDLNYRGAGDLNYHDAADDRGRNYELDVLDDLNYRDADDLDGLNYRGAADDPGRNYELDVLDDLNYRDEGDLVDLADLQHLPDGVVYYPLQMV
jgi:hypothetical protein